MPPTDPADEQAQATRDDALEAAKHDGAEGGFRDSSALRTANARWWRDVPRVSGIELAWALRRIGLDAHLGGPDHMVLMRGREALAIVPLKDELHPAYVRSLLQTLGVTLEQLGEFLARP